MTALRFSNGTLELLKWIALVLMTGDHIDAAFFGRSLGWLTEAGRVAMPIFSAVLAYNLARPAPAGFLAIPRLVRRLLLVGLIAYPFHVVTLGQGWLVLNILFAFAVAAQAIYWIRGDGRLGPLKAAVLVGLSGPFLEFQWAAPVLTVAWWLYWEFHRPGRLDAPVVLLAVAMAGLCWVNGNLWAMLALPVVLGLRRVQVELPRLPRLFYVYYPAHLAVLAGLVLLNY